MTLFKSYKDWSIKSKLLVLSALFTVGSVFLVSFLSYLKYTQHFEKQSAEQTQQIVEQVSYNMNTYLDDLFRLSLTPYRNDSLMQALEETEPGSEIFQLDKRRLTENFLDEIMIYPRQDIIRVFILTDEIYSSGRFPLSVDTETNFHNFDWYQEAIKTQNPIIVPTHIEQLVKNKGPKVFSIVRQLRSTRNTEKILGVIKVDANYKGVSDICNKVNMGQEGGLFIIDANNNLIYSSLTKLNPLDVYGKIKNSAASQASLQLDQGNYLINTSKLPLANWTIVAVNSASELNKTAVQTRNTAFLFAILCSCFAIVILYVFSKRFLKPLLNIVVLMKQVERGNLAVRVDNQRKDEIGYLGLSFNALVSQINVMLDEKTELVKEVYETKLLQQEAQIQALFNQIRPHFIFNTLNMISLSMQTGKQEKAIDHIHKLSSILRSMTLWDKDIPLYREIELLQAYLDIQSSRYEGRLAYEINLSPALMSSYIPALLLQPIVENAVIHGCETKREKTTIRIYNREAAEGIALIVEDSGRGMSRDKLLALQTKLLQPLAAAERQDPNEKASIGLLNVNQRIKLKYGAGFGLEINSQLEHGTQVKIYLPIHLDQEGAADV